MLFGISLAVHGGYVFSGLPALHRFPMDGHLYWDLAGNLAREGRFVLSRDAFHTVAAGESTLFWTPLYPLLLAAILQMGGNPELILKGVQAFFAACAPLLLYPAARRLLRGPFLWIFLGVAAFYPYYFLLSAETASEILALVLCLSALSLSLGPENPRLRHFVALGAVLAGLCLTRPEFLVFAAGVFGWTALRLRRKSGGFLGAPLLGMGLAFTACMLPWLARNLAVSGALVFTTRSGYSLAYQNEYFHRYSRGQVASEEEWTRDFPSFSRELERYRYLQARAGRFIREHPVTYITLCAKRIASMALPPEAKAAIYRVMGRRDIKADLVPGLYRYANGVFLLGLWALVIPAVIRFLWMRGGRFEWTSAPGLLAVVLLGQMSVYALFAYVEYQRSLIDLPFLLLGAALWQAADGPTA